MGIYQKKHRRVLNDFKNRPLVFRTLVCLLVIVIIQYSPTQISAQTQLSLSRPLRVKWKYETSMAINLTPAVNKDTVYLPLTAGDIISLQATDGEFNWKTETGGDISASPVADERGVYIASETNIAGSTSTRATGTLRALGRSSGVTLWMRPLQSPIRGVLAANQDTIFGGASDGRIYAVQKESGNILWVLKHSAPFLSNPILSEDRLYIGSEDGTLFCIDQKTGRTFWRYRTRGPLRAPVAVAGQTVFIGSADSYVYAINESDGRFRWRVRTGASVQSVLLTQNGLVVTSFDNFVYFLSLNRGGRLWKRQLAGRVAAQPLAIEEGALFAPLAGDECIILDLRDGKRLNSLLVGEDNNTAASPIATESLLLLTTRKGLFAYSGWTETVDSSR